MEIDGKKLQEKLIVELSARIQKLKKKGITPGIGIVTLGEEDSWAAYVGQKIKLANMLGISSKLVNLRPKTTEEVIVVIEKLNQNINIHGLIVQRPFPIYIDTERIIQTVSKVKDIDGFRSDSLFEVPVFLAVIQLITQASQLTKASDFKFWLSNQAILVVGKGETAGKPIITGLNKLGITPTVMDSKTENRDSLFQKADIIIFATGKDSNPPLGLLKKGCILIGIGLHREDTKLVGDFDQNTAEKLGLIYTPSPRGVGPVNLYYLFENLVKACEKFA